MKKIFYFLAIGSLLAVGCKKDKKTCDLNSGNLQGSYKITAVGYQVNASSASVDDFATWQACEKDDITVFNSNGSVSYHDAGTACTPTTEDTGVWSLSGSQLSLDGSTGTITSFDCNGMTVVFTDGTTGEIYTYTLARQ